MHPKKYAVAATLFGGLLISSVASAQSADADRYNNHNANRNAPMPNAGTTRAGTAPQAGATNHAGISTRTGITCPVGCAPIHVTSAAERARRRAAARRSREEAMRQHEQEIQQARADQERQDQERIAAEQARAEQCARDLAMANDRLNRADAERAERERLERERMAALTPLPTVAPPRGGGPGGLRSHVYFGAEGGVAGFVGPMHNQVYAGPAWGAHLGWGVTRWFGLEGRYLGSFHDGYNPAVGDGPGLLASAFSGVGRFTIPSRYVQPYLFGGLGVVHYSVTGTNDAQTGLLHNHTAAYAPSGIGVNIPVGSHWALTGEGSYNFLLESNDSTAGVSHHTVNFDNGFYTATAGIRTNW